MQCLLLISCSLVLSGGIDAAAERGEAQAVVVPQGQLQGAALPQQGLEQVESDFERWQRKLERGGKLPVEPGGHGSSDASTQALLNYSRTMRERLQALKGGKAREAAQSSSSSSVSPAVLGERHPASKGEDEAERGDESPQSVAGGLPPCGDLAALALQGGRPGRSPAAIYAESFAGWLRKNPYQLCIAVFAVVVGLLSAWDGPGVWRALFTTAVAASAAGVARFELEALDLVANQASEVVLVAQAAAVVALAASSGFEGSQVLLGAAVGAVGAYGCGDTARAWEDRLPGVAAAWYTCGAVLGILVYTVWRRPVLAVLGPLFGGVLVSSGIGVLASRACLLAGKPSPALLPPSDAPWFSAAAALVGGQDFLAGHGICALLALVVHGCSERRRLPAVCILVGCVALTGLAAVSGFECRRHAQDSAACPSWLRSAGMRWQWPLFGCTLWAALTAAAAWRQLGTVQAMGARETRGFWFSYWSSALGFGSAEVLAKEAAFQGDLTGDEEEARLLTSPPTSPKAAAASVASPMVMLPAIFPGGAVPAAQYQALLATHPTLDAGPVSPAPASNAVAGPADASNVVAGPASPSLSRWLSSKQQARSAPFAPPGSGV